MFAVRSLFSIGWPMLVMAVLAIISAIYDWPKIVTIPAIALLLILGLLVMSTDKREKELKQASLDLREVAGYFYRRFAGHSSLSIFMIIDTLFNTENSKLWNWARSCDTSRRVFDTWCDSFINRVEADLRTRMFDLYLHNHLNELWIITTHYYEFVEQFYEIASKIDLPEETVLQYNRFVTEYNAYIQKFREIVTSLKNIAKTQIEPPSIKLAMDIPLMKQAPIDADDDNEIRWKTGNSMEADLRYFNSKQRDKDVRRFW